MTKKFFREIIRFPHAITVVDYFKAFDKDGNLAYITVTSRFTISLFG